MEHVEINQIDTSFERTRIKDKAAQNALLNSILESGIRDPLMCAIPPQGRLILFDGFKRLHCAVKLGVRVVPVSSIGSDEATAIIQLLRISNAKTLSILEQAALVDELNQAHRMSVSQIAQHLERSPAWVSLRIGLIGSMSETVKEAIFSGCFPVRSYMYTMRTFTRVKGIKKADIDAFVKSVSGKSLSIRMIEFLSHGFFRGGPDMREQIEFGNIDWTLNQLKQQAKSSPPVINEWEAKTLKNLELVQGCIVRIPYLLKDTRIQSNEFFSEADLLTETILKSIGLFIKTLRWFYDQRREEKSNPGAFWGREKEERDSPPS